MKEIGLINVDSFKREVMTSKEIAEVTGKNHADVMRDIRNILSQLPENQRKSKIELIYYKQKLPNGGCKEQPMYQLDKKSCLLLASGYNVILRAKIINRWEELETKERQNVPALPTYAEALRQLADKVEENERLQLENKAMEPKAEFFDAVADSKDAISMNEVAKVLAIKGMGRNNLFEFLRQNKILMSNNVPFQTYVDRGYFRVIEQKYMKQGEPCMNIKTLVYQKGVEFIRRTIEEKTTGNIN